MKQTEMAMTTIKNMMARTFFVDYWATEEEEAGRTYPGRNLFDVAPDETPEWALRMARETLVKIEEMNRAMTADIKTVKELWEKVVELGAWEDTIADAEDFGYKLAMEVMGTGVSLLDDPVPDEARSLIWDFEIPFLESAVYATTNWDGA